MVHSGDLPNVEILRFKVDDVPMTNSTAIAFATVRIGDFTIHGASLRRPYDHHSDTYLMTPGRGTAGISLSRHSAVRDAVEAALKARYRDETGIHP